MLNHSTIIGRMVRTPQISYSQNGAAVARFTIASDQNRKTYNPKNRQYEYKADFISCKMWGRGGYNGQQADNSRVRNLYNIATQGRLMCAFGKVAPEHYPDANGNMIYRQPIEVFAFDMLDKKPQNQGQQQSGMVQNGMGGQGGYPNGNNYPGGQSQTMNPFGNGGQPNQNGGDMSSILGNPNQNRVNNGAGQPNPNGMANNPMPNGNGNNPMANPNPNPSPNSRTQGNNGMPNGNRMVKNNNPLPPNNGNGMPTNGKIPGGQPNGMTNNGNNGNKDPFPLKPNNGNANKPTNKPGNKLKNGKDFQHAFANKGNKKIDISDDDLPF